MKLLELAQVLTILVQVASQTLSTPSSEVSVTLVGCQANLRQTQLR